MRRISSIYQYTIIGNQYQPLVSLTPQARLEAGPSLVSLTPQARLEAGPSLVSLTPQARLEAGPSLVSGMHCVDVSVMVVTYRGIYFLIQQWFKTD